MREEITGTKKIRYEFGTLEDNNRAYPLYIKEQKTHNFLKKIQDKQEAGKNYKFFIVYRVELISFEHEGEYYNVEFKKKVLSPSSALVKEVAKIVTPEGENIDEYVSTYYNK